MLHPVGSLPPRVYWRRRLLFVVLSVLVLALAVYVLVPGGGGTPSAAPAALATRSTSMPTPSVSATTTAASSAVAPTTASAAAATPATSTAPAPSPSATALPATCDLSKLKVSAQASASRFKVGDHPTLYLQVVNPGPAPCVQDLADPQVELQVFNGQARLWGSHDCLVQPGTDLKTLAVNTPVQVGVQWSGLTAQPGCRGVRQRVGAGSYTVYALLSGARGVSTTITIG